MARSHFRATRLLGSLLAFACLAATMGAHAQEASPNVVAPLEIVNPFRLGLADLANLVIPAVPAQTLVNGKALGLAADGVSAAILALSGARFK